MSADPLRRRHCTRNLTPSPPRITPPQNGLSRCSRPILSCSGIFPLARTTVTMSKLSSSSTPGAAKVHWFRSTDFQSVVLGVVRTHILKIRRLQSLTVRSIKTAFTCPGPYPDPRRADTRPPPTHIDRKLCRNLGERCRTCITFLIRMYRPAADKGILFAVRWRRWPRKRAHFEHGQRRSIRHHGFHLSCRGTYCRQSRTEMGASHWNPGVSWRRAHHDPVADVAG